MICKVASKITAAFLIVLLFFALLAKCASAFTIGDNSKALVIAIALLMVCIAAAGIVLIHGDKIKNKISEILDKLSLKKMLLIILGVSLITKFAFILMFQIDCTFDWDIAHHYSFAVDIWNNGTVTDWGYAINHQYSWMFSFLLIPAIALFGESIIGVSVWVSLLFTGAALLYFDTLSYLFNKKTAFIAIMIWLILPEEIILPQYLFHETSIIIFTALSSWCLLRAMPSAKSLVKKVLYFILFCVSAFLGMAMSPSSRILIIALIICVLLKFIKEKKSAANIAFSAASFVALAFILINTQTVTNYFAMRYINVPDDFQRNVQLGQGFYGTLFTGSLVETGGSFSQKEYEIMDSYYSQHTQEENLVHLKTRLKENYKHLINNPDELIKLLSTKYNKIWGTQKIQMSYSQSYSNLYSKLGLIFFSWSQIIGFVIAFVALASVSSKPFKNNPSKLFFPLLFIGYTLLFMLIEIHGRYTSHLQLLIIIICVSSSGKLFQLCPKIRKKLRITK